MLEPGVIFDTGHDTVENESVRVIRLAELEGYELHPDTQAVLWAHENGEEWWNEVAQYSIGEALQDECDRAVDWLNDHAVPANHWVGFDGEMNAFGVWEIEDYQGPVKYESHPDY